MSKVEVRTVQGDLLSLTLDDDVASIVVQDIQGLDPGKAVLSSSAFSGMDGGIFQSARMDTRNIVLQLGIDPDPAVGTVRSVRQQLYAFFMPKTTISLRFIMVDASAFDITATVESFTSPMFVAEPVVNISLICYDPDFYNPTPVDVTGMTTADTVPTTIAYAGTTETGLVLTIGINRTLGEFTVYHVPPDGTTRVLDFVASLLAGDVLTISTVTGQKGATLNRGGTISSLLYAISPQSTWLQLEPGTNTLLVSATGAGIPLDIQYTTRYGGL